MHSGNHNLRIILNHQNGSKRKPQDYDTGRGVISNEVQLEDPRYNLSWEALVTNTRSSALGNSEQKEHIKLRAHKPRLTCASHGFQVKFTSSPSLEGLLCEFGSLGGGGDGRCRGRGRTGHQDPGVRLARGLSFSWASLSPFLLLWSFLFGNSERGWVQAVGHCESALRG